MKDSVCYFCQTPGNHWDFPYWRAFRKRRGPNTVVLDPVYFGGVGNVWACDSCIEKEEKAFKDRNYADPAFGDYEGECIYAHGCAQDNTGVTSCLLLMDWQQDPIMASTVECYGTKQWDRVCLPCQAYYECARKEITDPHWTIYFMSFTPRPPLKEGQLFA